MEEYGVDSWPKSRTSEEAKPNISDNISLERKASSQPAETRNEYSLPGQAAAINVGMRLPYRIISNPHFQQPPATSGPGQEGTGHTEREQYQQQGQSHSGVRVSLTQSDDPNVTTENTHTAVSTAQPLTSENNGRKASVLPSTSPLMIPRMEPTVSKKQAYVATVAPQEMLNRLYSKARGAQTDTQMEGEILHNAVSGPDDKTLYVPLHYVPAADTTTAPGPARSLSADLTSTMFTARRTLYSRSYNNVSASQAPSQCDKVYPETQTPEMPSTSRGANPKKRVTFFIPEDDKDTSSELQVSSQDPSQYHPIDVEQMPQHILGPSQHGSKQQQQLYKELTSTVKQQHLDYAQGAQDWTCLPGPAVSTGRSQMIRQTPVSFPVTTLCYYHAPLKLMLDADAPSASEYVSVMIKIQDFRKLFGTSPVHQTGDPGSDPYFVDVVSNADAQRHATNAEYARPPQAL